MVFEPFSRLVGHTADVIKASITDMHIVSASADTTLKVWDLSTQRHMNTLSAHSGPISDFQSLQQLIVSASTDGIKGWDLRQPGHVKITSSGSFSAVSMSAKIDSQLIFGDFEGNIHFMDLRSGKFQHSLTGHGSTVSSIDIAEDGKVFLSSSIDGTARLWSRENADCLSTFASPSRSGCMFGRLLPNCRVTCLFSDSTLRCWSARDRSALEFKIVNLPLGKSAKNFEFDNGLLVVPTNQGGIQFLNHSGNVHYSSIKVHSDDVSHVEISGNAMVSTGYGVDSSIVLWKRGISEIDQDCIMFSEVFPQIVGL